MTFVVERFGAAPIQQEGQYFVVRYSIITNNKFRQLLVSAWMGMTVDSACVSVKTAFRSWWAPWRILIRRTAEVRPIDKAAQGGAG